MINKFSKIKRTIAFAVVLLLMLNSCRTSISEPEITPETEMMTEESTTVELVEPVIDPIISKVSSVKIRNEEGVGKPLYSNSTGIHGGHESRIVRTASGTFAVYITAEYPDETYDFSWDEFSVVKILSYSAGTTILPS